jgi:hypothetical protein
MLAAVIALTLSAAADSAPDPAAAALDRSRVRVDRAGMATLGGWAVANLAVGGVGMATASDPRVVAFHQGNAAWNVVNLGIAGASLWSMSRERPGDGGLPGAVEREHRAEVALALNAGLDVAYVTAGAWLWERGGRLGAARQAGFGQALVLQGAFLLAFDLALLRVHRRAPALALDPWLTAAADGAEVGVSRRF